MSLTIIKKDTNYYGTFRKLGDFKKRKNGGDSL